MAIKHRLKIFLREAYARLLWHSGLHRLCNRCMPKRLTILAGHCIASDSNAELPADMKLSAQRLTLLLRELGRFYDFVTVGEGERRLSRAGGRSMVALSLDDGYRDNAQVLPGVLAPFGAKATIFLETRALTERRLNWSHKFFWLLDQLGPEEFVQRCARVLTSVETVERLREALASTSQSYRLKLVLKYQAQPSARDKAIDVLFEAAGGPEQALCERLYMSWEEARALAAVGYEFGGHTHTHAILSRLEPAEQRQEIEEGRAALERALGKTATYSFAYPFGRRWDYNDAASDAVRAAGFALAVTTHPGTNTAHCDRYRLARWMVDEATSLHCLAAEACGGFALLRRLGLELAE